MTSGFRDLQAPRNQKEAYKIDKDRWIEAELAELKVLKDRNTWDLVVLPDGKKVVGSRYTYSVKMTGDGEWYKDKARFIVQGFATVAGEDYTETWAAVARLELIRMTAVFAAAYQLVPWQSTSPLRTSTAT